MASRPAVPFPLHDTPFNKERYRDADQEQRSGETTVKRAGATEVKPQPKASDGVIRGRLGSDLCLEHLAEPRASSDTISTPLWLPSERTGGWVGSHFDVVDKFSCAERPTDRRAYTHELNLELDTSVSIFNWLSEGRRVAALVFVLPVAPM